MKRIHKINSLKEYEGYKRAGKGDRPIYISRNEDGKAGITDSSDRLLLPFKYDGIGILGFGILQLIRNGKMGVACIAEEDNRAFYVSHVLDCKYDYVKASRDNMVTLSSYADPGELDVHDLFLPKLGYLIKNAAYERLTLSCYLVRNADGEYILNADNGNRIDMGEGLYYRQNISDSPEETYLYFLERDTENTVIARINDRGEYFESDRYGNVYTYYIDEFGAPRAAGFIGERDKKYYMMDIHFQVHGVYDSFIVAARARGHNKGAENEFYTLTEYKNGTAYWGLPAIYDSHGRMKRLKWDLL